MGQQTIDHGNFAYDPAVGDLAVHHFYPEAPTTAGGRPRSRWKARSAISTRPSRSWRRPITDCPAGTINPLTGSPVSGPQAPKGTQLPITPRFKGNLNARYTFDVDENEAFPQAAIVHVGERRSDLRVTEGDLLGNLAAYQAPPLSGGERRRRRHLTQRRRHADARRRAAAGESRRPALQREADGAGGPLGCGVPGRGPVYTDSSGGPGLRIAAPTQMAGTDIHATGGCGRARTCAGKRGFGD